MTGRVLFKVCVVCSVLLLVIGCSQQPQQRPEVDRGEVRELIREELRSPEVRQELEVLVQEEVIAPLILDTLRTPAGQEALKKEVTTQVQSADMQKEFETIMLELVNTPDVKQRLQQAVTQILMQILQGSGGQGGSQQGSQQGGG